MASGFPASHVCRVKQMMWATQCHKHWGSNYPQVGFQLSPTYHVQTIHKQCHKAIQSYHLGIVGIPPACPRSFKPSKNPGQQRSPAPASWAPAPKGPSGRRCSSETTGGDGWILIIYYIWYIYTHIYIYIYIYMYTRWSLVIYIICIYIFHGNICFMIYGNWSKLLIPMFFPYQLG